MTQKIVNHWGVWVDSESPIPAVYTNNRIEYLSDEIFDSGSINLTMLHAEEEFKRVNSQLSEEDMDEELSLLFEDWDSSADTILIGTWKKDEDGEYIPDESGEYAAIVGEIYTQCVWSKTVTRGALCSPCFPGQVDSDSDGDFLAYALPADLLGNLD